jgi:chromosome partitioning protein
MSIVPLPSAYSAPHVLVVANLKGGSGKSTIAMHLIVALLKAGKRVGSFDLDVNRQTLTHYIENRRDWARQSGLALELPVHCRFDRDPDCPAAHGRASDVDRFVSRFTALEHSGHRLDFVVIDTAGGARRLDLLAHGLADTLVTPIGESLLDLDAIVRIGSTDTEPQLTHYATMVAHVLDARRTIYRRPTDWIVVRNRLMPHPSRNEGVIGDVLESIRPKLGFRTARGLSEHPAFRELFTTGLTTFDPVQLSTQPAKPDRAVLVARAEVRRLVEQLNLNDRAAQASSPPAAVRATAAPDALAWVDAPSLWMAGDRPEHAKRLRAERLLAS